MNYMDDRWEERYKKILGDNGFLQDLKSRYEGNDRVYHGHRHIDSVCKRIDELLDKIPADPYLPVNHIYIAAFYHDAVYVPGFEWNEQLSADMALDHLDLLGSPWKWDTDYIDGLILTTKDHKPVTGLIGCEILIDADLYELGTDKYKVNGQKVRSEYRVYSDKEFNEGRKKFLESFLARDKIFNLPGQEDLELNARKNMQEELDQLNGDG